MNNATFRTMFPEFSSALSYPEDVLDLWGNIAEESISTGRFGAERPLAVMLWVAHNLISLGFAGDSDGGAAGGAIASKTVGSLSVSYDTQGSKVEGAGQLNSTSYGRRYADLVRQYCSGPAYACGR